ncbi:MAG: hypothetical protein IE916_00050 [Epsilonproteobacteria bacterium]|nr:hypothetical protein [Campylobacterota bacterium]
MGTISDTLTKVVLFTVQLYIEKAKEEGLEPSDELMFIHNRINQYRKKCKFKPEESIFLARHRESSEELNKILHIPVSFLAFAPEILKLWAKDYPPEARPFLGIPENLLMMGKGIFAKSMLTIKAEGKEDYYNENKEIIDASVETAELWYGWHKKTIRGITFEGGNTRKKRQAKTNKSKDAADTFKQLRKLLAKFKSKGNGSLSPKSIFLGHVISRNKLIIMYSTPRKGKVGEEVFLNKLENLAKGSKEIRDWALSSQYYRAKKYEKGPVVSYVMKLVTSEEDIQGGQYDLRLKLTS